MCLRLQTFRAREPIVYKMFRALIEFAIRIGNAPKTTAHLSDLIGIPQSNYGICNNLGYFIDHYVKIFIHDDSRAVPHTLIESSCERIAYKKSDDDTGSSGYVVYIREDRRNLASIPDYENYYDSYNKDRKAKSLAKHQAEVAAKYAASGRTYEPYQYESSGGGGGYVPYEYTGRSSHTSDNFAGASSHELGIALMIRR